MKGKRGVSRFLLAVFVAIVGLNFTTTSFAATEVTDKVQLTKTRMLFNRLTKENYFNVTLTNISEDVLLAPLKVIIDSISNANVTIVNADGMTEDGKPYFEYADSPTTFSNGDITDSKKWIFANPTSARFSYTTIVHQGDIGSVAPVTAEQIVTDPETGQQYVIGQVLVTAENDVSKADIENLVTQYGGTVIGHIKFVEIYQVSSSELSLTELQNLITQLTASSLVKAAIINSVETINADPNPNLLPNDQWNESNGDSESWEVYPWEDAVISNRVPQGNNWAMESMRMPEAWHLAYRNENGEEIDPEEIRIGIIDLDFPVEINESGDVINNLHEDLEFYWANTAGSPAPTTAKEPKKYQHGHHVAGIIGAKTNEENAGVSGVVRKASLYAYKTSLDKANILFIIDNS